MDISVEVARLNGCVSELCVVDEDATEDRAFSIKVMRLDAVAHRLTWRDANHASMSVRLKPTEFVPRRISGTNRPALRSRQIATVDNPVTFGKCGVRIISMSGS
jgi:hypothetical protein